VADCAFSSACALLSNMIWGYETTANNSEMQPWKKQKGHSNQPQCPFLCDGEGAIFAIVLYIVHAG
jgi:hypothetical protein